MATLKVIQGDIVSNGDHFHTQLSNVSCADFEGAEAVRDILVVTAYPQRFLELGKIAKIASTCNEGWGLMEKFSFSAIFCDLGQLGPSESGFRFANALARIETQPRAFLMADQITENNHKWAIRQGALGLIVRSPEGIRQVLAEIGLTEPDATSESAEIQDSQPGNNIDSGFVTAVVLQLRRHVGPIADELIRDAMERYSSKYLKRISPAQLISEVADYIEDSNDRKHFVQAANSTNRTTRK